ncbi:MAG: hypothetical protein IJH13_01710 [Bacilli bacterium]|nr:hypothetical protein [Bacilli bacterium]
MKGNKKILTLAVLILLVAVCFGAYAIYRSAADGDGSVAAAEWSVKINNTDIDSANFDFDADDITWTSLTGYNDTIAPGSEGYIDIAVDATGSEVDVLLSATLDTSNLPTGMTATVQGGGSQTIAYNASSMATTVRINIAWAGAESDTTAKDTTDMNVAGTDLSLPVTLTAKQSLTSHAS